MKKIHMIAALLAMLLPTMVLAGGSSTTYYAALKAQVSGNCSGMGKVYAGTSNSAPSASSYDASSSQTSAQESETQNSTKDLYAFALPNDGYEFVGWSRSNNGSDLGKGTAVGDAYRITASVTFNSESSPNAQTWYATFKEKVLDAFSITFETSANGTYTVDGAAPANKTGLTKATSVLLASSDSNFLNWNINGTVVNNNPYTLSCTANTTVSADFLTADQVTSVTTLADLTAALSNTAYKKISIPSGASLTVAKGSTVTVPSGKKLVVDGTLVVVGTVSNSGVISGSGKLYKISYSIDQGEVITVKTADGKECGAMTCTCQTTKMPRYCKTTVTQSSPSVNGTVSCTTSWGVLLNGTTAYAISKQNPKAVKVNVDTATDANGKQSVVNKITSVVVNGDVDEVTENKVYVLFANCSATGPIVDSKLDNQGVVDCAGKTLSASKNSHSSFGMSILNGSVSFSASQWQNAHAAFFNMSSVSLSKVKGTGSTYYFYDCGTKASPCSVSISYYSNTRTSDYKTAYFYSGYYSYSFNTTNDSGKCNVYGGSYTSDPASYIPTAYDGILQSKYDGSKYYVVTDYTPPSYVCAVGGVEYETLPDAVAAAGNGSLITLSAAIELEETLTIPSGKNISISLEKHTIQGGKIVNNGTLTITDAITGNGTTVNDVSGGMVKCDIENNGTLDFIFGSYTGTIVNKAGALTTHNGLFSGALTKNGGTVNLKGGHFTADVSSFVTADGYDVITYGGKNSVCELPNGTLYDTTVSSAAGYGATPYGTSDYNLLVKWVGGKGARTDYSTSEWSRLAELLCFYQVFNNKGLDPTLVFDRDVAKNSVNLYAKSGSQEMPVDFDLDVTAGTPYRALSEFLNPKYASKTFKAIFSESISTVGIAVSDKSGNNNGTLCKAMVELWEDVRASDYSSTGHKLTNTVYVVGKKLFTLGAGTNAAMIRPATGAATFYSTLGAAMDAAADGGTVMLANDCDTALPLNKAGTYTFDTMGFAHSDEVSLGAGLKIISQTTVDSSAKVLVPDAVATTYVVENAGTIECGETKYVSIEAAVEATSGNTIAVTVTANDTETVTLPQGKTLTVTVNDGVTANVTVEVPEGSFLETATDGNTTTYESKKITVEMKEPQSGSTVEVTKIEGGTETTVSDSSEISAAIAKLEGNHDVSRTDNTDKLDVLDKITVTPTKIVEDVTSGTMIIRSVTFDVVPHLNAGQSLTTGQTLKFRLPVDAAATQLAAVVYHGDAQFGIYSVQTYNNEKFVEVESDAFSPYGYDLLDGETANPVAAIGTTGYATFAEAIEAANAANVDEITILNGATESPDADWKVVDGKLVRKTYVAQIGTTKYETLAEAIAAVPTDGTETTITMIADETIEVTGYALTIPANKNVVLDLNGKTVAGTCTTAATSALIRNQGTFTIQDSSEGKTGKLLFTADPVWHYSEADPSGYASNLIRNEGTLVVNGGTLYNASEGSACYAIDSFESGKVTINGGTIDAAKASAVRMFYNNGGKITVNDGTIGHYNGDDDCSYMGVQVQSGSNADIEIKGGTIAGNYAFYSNGTGGSSVNISGGTFDGYVGFGSAGPDDIAISGGTFLEEVVTWGAQEGFISGGNFRTILDETYCADGYIESLTPVIIDGNTYYVVIQGTYVAQIVRGGEVLAKYTSFGAALEAAQSGDTVQLLADVEGVTETFELHGKNITIDGQGSYSITAGANTEPRSVVQSYGGARNMFVVLSGNVTFKGITLDGGDTHYYTFLVQAKNGTTTFDNVSLLHGGEADSSGTAGVGYGAAVQVDGATVLVTNSFYACTGTNVNDVTTGVFPFTALLYQSGGIHFDDGVTAGIGDDLLLVGMVGAVDVSTDEGRAQVSEMLGAMNVPAGYYPYTLKLGDSEMTSFTGASPLGWNGIIDYGKEIMVSANTSMGMDMNPATTPVEVGLLTDTILPEVFTFEDANLTVNGNGNAISGTIEYTDNAGLIEDIVLGTEDNPLVLDMTGLGEGNAIHLGSDVAATSVIIKVTEEQATSLGHAIVTWDAAHETEEEAASLETGIVVEIVDAQGEPILDPETNKPKEASVIWDLELGLAYIGPCEARLTGPTHSSPIYTTLADAIARAAQTGDTVTLLMDIANVSGTYEIDKSITLDGAGYKVTAAPVATHRDVVNAWAGSTSMFKLKTGDITFRNITLDGDATHAYTFLISADNSSAKLTTENITLLHGGELCGDANGVVVEKGAGYGAGIHLNNGAALTVKDGFYADTHGAPAEAGQTIDKSDGVFPFTGILPEGGSSVLFDLVDDSNEHPTVEIGEDLLLVGMVGVIPHDEVQGILDYMKVPSRFIPYTLTLSDGSAYAFTGASPLGWNDIIDYGKEIMDVSSAIGYDGLDKDTTPVEVGLLTDTALPETFTFADTNFTVNGNGHALSGTIKYTDTAGSVKNIALGSETAALVVDLSEVTNLPVTLGSGVDVANVVVNLTGEQASFGTAVFKWDAESEDGAPQHEQVVIKVAGSDSDKELVWDDEIGVAYIGPCEARLTGPGREPGYMDLTNAFDMAVGGDTVTLFWSNVTLNASLNLPAGTLLFATNKYELALGEDAALVFTNATTVFRSEMDLLDVIGLAGDCANGYWLRHEADGTTNVYSVVERGEYIVTGNTEDGGVGTAVIKVSDEWIAANIGANVRTVNEIDAYLNSTNSTTNLREWEMYVLNQETPFRVTAVGKADNAVSTTLVAPASSETTGFTVAYSLDETLADGSVKTPGTQQASRDFAVPVASVTTHAFYRVRAHLTSGESTLVVDSANTIGVLKATASTAQTIVAVPWTAFGGGDVSVADLLRTDGLSVDDELFVYNPSTQNFRAWTLGSGKTWEPTTVIAAGTNATPGDDASSVTVARGSGVLLKRGSVSAPLCFVGEVASGGKTALGAAQTSGSDGAQSWNLVASPSVEALDIANFPAPSSGGYDRIIVLTSGAPLNLTYKNGKWGYNKVEVKNGMAVPTRVTEGVSIPAGVGFWYLNSGAAREIEW